MMEDLRIGAARLLVAWNVRICQELCGWLCYLPSHEEQYTPDAKSRAKSGLCFPKGEPRMTKKVNHPNT